jgi:hypothetical protein
MLLQAACIGFAKLQLIHACAKRGTCLETVHMHKLSSHACLVPEQLTFTKHQHSIALAVQVITAARLVLQ